MGGCRPPCPPAPLAAGSLVCCALLGGRAPPSPLAPRSAVRRCAPLVGRGWGPPPRPPVGGGLCPPPPLRPAPASPRPALSLALAPPFGGCAWVRAYGLALAGPPLPRCALGPLPARLSAGRSAPFGALWRPRRPILARAPASCACRPLPLAWRFGAPPPRSALLARVFRAPARTRFPRCVLADTARGCLRATAVALFATTAPVHHPRGGLSSPRVPSPLHSFEKMESTSFHTYLMYTK